MVRPLPAPDETWTHLETGRAFRIVEVDANTGRVRVEVEGRDDTVSLRFLFRECRSPGDRERTRAGFAALLQRLEKEDEHG